MLNEIDILKTIGKLPTEVLGISQDSRLISSDYIFAARSGKKFDGMKFVPNAMKAGANMVLTDTVPTANPILPVIQVEDFRKALTKISHLVFENPSKRLKLIGITGTDGKTSTIHYLKSIFEPFGCGMIGTIGYDTGLTSYEASLTTPDIDRICQLLFEMSKLNWVVMEVSSHALKLGRVEGIEFSAAGFTNLSSEHRDFHPTMQDYADSKAILFKMLNSNSPSVINISDSWSSEIIRASTGKIITFGKIGSDADLEIDIKAQSLDGGVFEITHLGEKHTIITSLIGSFQGENIALSAGIALGCGLSWDQIVTGIGKLYSIPGRMESVNMGQDFSVLIDFSHTDQALFNALNAIRPLCKGELTTVFGCGGDRDVSKRPRMGLVAAEYSDKVFITSDNPRSENPEEIINAIAGGINRNNTHKTKLIEDRREAIFKAISEANKNDVILIAGKGAETTQEINGIKHQFNDKQTAIEALKTL